ncbi:MAG: electron transporter RnfB [Spirochaetes bacterium]|nr:MAG: electron transporter RnfB [Spirochaetota bacterium]
MPLLKILYSFISVTSIGGVLGLGLAIASKLLQVKRDEKLMSLEETLPGLNCGACGYAGCSQYAEAIVKENEELTLCGPGGQDTASELADLMGVKIEISIEKKVTQVHCRGGQATSEYLYSYRGVMDCNAMYLLFEGDKVCKYGCLGLGSCIKVCPTDAIDYDEEGLVWVDRDKCISCGKCIDVCPTGVMKWVPYSADYIVACNSRDKASVVKKYCSVGCTGCKRCEKKSPEGGFVVEDYLATIDYKAKGERENAADDCPSKCIIPAVKTATKVST